MIHCLLSRTHLLIDVKKLEACNNFKNKKVDVKDLRLTCKYGPLKKCLFFTFYISMFLRAKIKVSTVFCI